MSTSKITLIGMYNHLNASGDDLFLHFNMPTGIDKDAVVDNILMRGGEFEALISDPYFLKDSIITWSKKWHWTFDRWLKAINIEYNPLENYDRFEEGSENQTDTTETNSTHEDTRTDNLLQNTAGRDTANTENTVSAFDSSNYTPHDKTEQSATNNVSVTNSGTQSQTGSVGGLSEMNSNKSHNLRIHGNIGVTTSQQMLQSEIDIAMFNLYDKIADIFLQEYVIPIY